MLHDLWFSPPRDNPPLPRELRGGLQRRRKPPAALSQPANTTKKKKTNIVTDDNPAGTQPRGLDPSLDDGYDEEFIVVELRARNGGPGWIDTGGTPAILNLDSDKLRALVHSRVKLSSKPTRKLDRAVYCPCAPERETQLVVCLVPKSEDIYVC